MTTHMNRKVKVLAASLSMAGVIVVLGFGCGMGFEPSVFVVDTSSMGSNGFNNVGGGQEIDDVGNLTVISGQATAFMPKTTAVLDNYISITGVQPSNNTRNIFNQKLGQVSETGSVLSTNAPLLFAYMSVGAEVCNDLIQRESGLNVNDRRFFRNQQNLNQNNNTASQISDAAITELVERFARNAWARQPASEEVDIVVSGVREMLAANQTSNQQKNDRRVALYVCTAMLASPEAYTF